MCLIGLLETRVHEKAFQSESQVLNVRITLSREACFQVKTRGTRTEPGVRSLSCCKVVVWTVPEKLCPS